MYSVLFIASDPVFIRPFIDIFSQKYNVRTAFGVDLKNNEKYMDLLEQIRDSDITFIDWADPTLIEMSRGLKTGKIITRLHSYEFFEGYTDYVNWDNIDKLILVNHSLDNMLRYRQSISSKKIKVIYHGIDANKFIIKSDRKKTNRVGIAGYINYKKDPSFAMCCFDAIYNSCPNLNFVWAGQHQDLRYHLEFINSMSKVRFPLKFESWQTDMNEWLNSCDYILSSSIFESCHLSILEGMACGVFPLVRSWRGAENIYPSHSLFTTPQMVAQKVYMNENNNIFGGNREETMELHREWVKQYFPIEREIEQIDKVIQEVLH